MQQVYEIILNHKAYIEFQTSNKLYKIGLDEYNGKVLFLFLNNGKKYHRMFNNVFECRISKLSL